MLGTDVVGEFASRGHEVVAHDLPEFDITDPMQTARIPAGELGAFDWAVNCAAYTAVDMAESERDAAFKVNALGVSFLAQSCQMAKVRLIHIGTDFVFDGSKGEPYVETDTPNPLGVYGESKWEGEKAALGKGAIVVRTAWLYGPNGPSFPRTMIRAWLEGKILRVVADQFGCPTYTGALARVLAEIAEKDLEPGLYHSAGPDAMSWHEYAVRALTSYRDARPTKARAVAVEAIRTEDWPVAAKRPKYSVLNCQKLREAGIRPMPATDISLRQFADRLE